MSERCPLCGELHDALSDCPCPLCLHTHAGSSCIGQGLCFLISDVPIMESSSRCLSCCRMCGQSHKSSCGCPCPRCEKIHVGTTCVDACALCNRMHDGDCISIINRHSGVCGQLHNAFVACPCPRCHGRHPDSDCRSVEEWRSNAVYGSFELFIGGSCRQCGQCHRQALPCPCPRCHEGHIGPDCRSSVAAIGQIDGPCQRCNVWHAAGLCAEVSVQYGSQSVPVPAAHLLNRAIAHNSTYQSSSVVPAHSDAASDRHDVGSMSTVCTFCGARFWQGESIQCCWDGSVVIPEQVIPEACDDIIFSPEVRRHLRSYNMAMSMASVGHEKKGFPDGVFVLSGKSYHQIGTLVPREGHAPNFAQIYAIDTTDATDRRSAVFGDRLHRETLQTLHHVLMVHNRYVGEFCRAVTDGVHELVWTTEDNIMGMQMGALVCANGSKRNVVLKRCADVNCPFANDLSFIDDGHPLYHTLAYPLLFPTGAPGWFAGMVSTQANGSSSRAVSLHDYGRYVLMHRQRCVVVDTC